MNNRIKQLRKHLNMSQTDFGLRIGVKQGTVAGYESGARVPLDAVVSSICREFKVNEEWLRTGLGSMFIQPSRVQKIAEFMESVMSDSPDSTRSIVVSYLADLDVEDWEALATLLRKQREN